MAFEPSCIRHMQKFSPSYPLAMYQDISVSLDKRSTLHLADEVGYCQTMDDDLDHGSYDKSLLMLYMAWLQDR